jgi:hypothetical protein
MDSENKETTMPIRIPSITFRCWTRNSALFSLLLGATSLCSANTTFNVNQTIGANSVTGTITTSGVVGAVSGADIVSSDLTYNGTLEIVDPTGAYVVIEGSDLTETADTLFFNYEDTGAGIFDPDFNYSGPGAQTTWFNVSEGSNNHFAPDGFEAIEVNNSLLNMGVAGNVAIAGASVPEPSTIYFTMAGIALLGLARKRIIPTFR